MADRDDLIADYREFTREITLRLERTLGALIREMRDERREMRDERREMRAESRAYFERVDRRIDELVAVERKHTDEVVAELRAQREALFHILDEMRGGGPATAT